MNEAAVGDPSFRELAAASLFFKYNMRAMVLLAGCQTCLPVAI